jgi:predicted nucleic acid-binding protein
VSTIAVAELLVKPFETADVTRVELCERFLLSLPNSEFVAPDDIIAREAARMRARHHVRTPDAIFLVTALVREAVFVSNDRALMRKGTTSGQVWEW